MARVQAVVAVGVALVAGGCASGSASPSSLPSSKPSVPASSGELTREQFCRDAGTTFLTVTAGAVPAGVRIAWRDNAFANRSPAYRIYRRAGADTRWQRLTELPPAAFGARASTSWIDRAAPGDDVEYGVTVIDGSCGETPLCAEAPCVIAQVGASTVRATALAPRRSLQSATAGDI